MPVVILELQAQLYLVGVLHELIRNNLDGVEHRLGAKFQSQQPQVLVLDEPTSFLDINNKLRLLSILKALVKDRGIAVVQTLHELDLAQRFSDKILCIKDGKADRLG